MMCNPSTDNFFKGLETYDSGGGLKKVLHGNIYQLKLLMLHAYCGWKKGYTFRLATEMTKAGKFDDVVVWYTDKNGDPVQLQCLQVKHSWELGNKISHKDLLKVENGDYSLAKYFNSFRGIKEKLVKNDGSSELNACIIWTNFPLDVVKDGETNNIVPGKPNDVKISVKKIDDKVEIERIMNFGDSTGELYQLLSGIDDNRGVYERLRNLTEAHALAKQLASCIYVDKDISPSSREGKKKTKIIHLYQRALVTEVIDPKGEDGKPAFLSAFETCDEDTDAGKFKRYFLEECRELIVKEKKGKNPAPPPTDGDVWLKIEPKLKASNISPTFGTEFKVSEDKIEEISRDFSKLILNKQDSQLQDPNAIVVGGTGLKKPRLRAHIIALLGIALELRGKKIQFTKDFFEDNDGLRDDIKEFRDNLRVKLGADKFEDLKNSHIVMENPTDKWKEFQWRNKLPDKSDIIEDRDIEEFLNKLYFAVSKPDEKELGISIKKQIHDDKTLNWREAAFVYDSFQKKMFTWLKVTGKKVRYFTDEHVQDFFDKVLIRKGDNGQGQTYWRLRTDSGKIADSEEDEE